MSATNGATLSRIDDEEEGEGARVKEFSSRRRGIHIAAQSWIVRKSRDEDLPALRNHFDRLDAESLYCRFGMVVSRSFLDQYVEEGANRGATIFVTEIEGTIRAIGELRSLPVSGRADAEAAFTVERPFRDRGVGARLMAELIEEARRQKICNVFVCFHCQNKRMRRIAEKFNYSVTLDGTDCVGRVWIPACSSPAIAPLPHHRPEYRQTNI
jgi:GNAT superfamily N-acetyltransferase